MDFTHSRHWTCRQLHLQGGPSETDRSGAEGNVLFNDALNTFFYGYMA